MAVEGRFVDQSDLEQHIGPDAIRRLYDDEGEGSASEDPLQLLVNSNEAIVIGSAARNYANSSLPESRTAALTTEGGRLLRAITLELIKGYAWSRYPEFARGDGQSTIDRAMGLVKMLARAELVLEGLNVDPANVGGEVIADDDDEDEPKQFWLGGGGTGIF
jgi:hypothetical protein